MKKLTIVALVAMLLLTAALPANAAVKATSVEIRGSVAGNGTNIWTNATFAGFFYDIDDNLGTETLTITAGSGSDYRAVGKSNITYNTTGQAKMLKVVDAKYNDSGSEAAAKGLEEFGKDKMAGTAGYYTIIGWMAEKYVAIKKQPNKLSKLMVEHGTSTAEKKTLTVGETWEIGSGYTLTANSIDAKASPRQVWLTLSKDGVKKDDKVVTSGGADSQPIYTYVEKSMCGETDVPIFVTYVDSVFAGATTDMVQFRYTWLINPTCTEVKSSDVFGIMKVTSTSGKLELTNSETTTTLSSDSKIDLFGNVKLRVADDSSALRYYPFVLKTEPGTYEVRGSVKGNGTSDWNNATFSGFFYDIDDNLGTETLTIIAGSGSDYRAVGKSNITYNTTGQEKMLKVVDAKYNDSGSEAAAKGLEQFGTSKMAPTTGYYTIIGWMAEKYVAIKEQPNKLSKLLVEHGTSSAEKKTLTVGETWEIGGGYTVTANSIDAKASPRQVWLTLSKDGVKKDDKVVTSGGTDSQPIYTYVEKSMCGETDVPILVTYVDSVFAGATTDMVQFRYTWLINPTCTEVKSSDVFGIMKVTSTSGKLELTNSETTTTLSSDSTIDLFGNVKLRVADDSSALRYYPFVEYLIEGEGVTPTPGPGTPTATVVGTPGVVTPVTNVTVTTPPVEEAAAPPVTAAATATKTEPGFEAIFAIAGLLAVAFLVLRQRK